jgi:CheY-like chemotaxis protein
MFTNGNHKKQVLLIDDNHKSSGDLLGALERQGYHVSIFNSFSEQLYKACTSVDIVLLNLFLPDKQGFDICRKIRVSQDTRPVPIIIISHKICPDDVVEGLYTGADDYVVRPYDDGELIARIEAVIRRSNIYKSAHLISKGEEAIIEELKKIIIERAITPYYQPIYQFEPFKTVGIEVLTRPNTDSMLSNPEILFKAAIEFGLYRELEIMAWKKAINAISDVLDGQSLFLNCDPNFIESIKCPKVKSLFDDAAATALPRTTISSESSRALILSISKY